MNIELVGVELAKLHLGPQDILCVKVDLTEIMKSMPLELQSPDKMREWAESLFEDMGKHIRDVLDKAGLPNQTYIHSGLIELSVMLPRTEDIADAIP
jgi:hypothetical protein